MSEVKCHGRSEVKKINIYNFIRLKGGILMNLGPTIHHVSGHCSKDFQGHLAKKVRQRRSWKSYELDGF